MPSFVHNGTGLVPVLEYVHDGTSLVPVLEYIHDGTSLVLSYTASVEGPAPVVASTTTAAQGASLGSTPVVLPSGLGAGDILLMAVDVRTSGAALSIPGWTSHPPAVVTGAQSFGFLSRPVVDAADAAALSGATVTLTSTVANRQAIRVLRITGGRGIDVVGSGSGTSAGTTRVIGPVTTTGPNRLLVAAWGTNDATVTITKDAAMTEVGSQINSGVANNSSQALVVATQVIAAAGSTGTRTATISATTGSLGQLIAISPAYV